MRQINKQAEPEAFVQWKIANKELISRLIEEGKTGDQIWAELKSSLNVDKVTNDYSKALLRKTLVSEQFYLCCYCNCEVKGDALDTKIEHFQPKEKYRDTIFDYQNLFAACNGGERVKPVELSCDSYKGKKDPITDRIISPLDGNAHIHFQYRENGQIIGKTEQGEKTIDFLNLDCKRLRLMRNAVIEAYIYNEELDVEEMIQEVEFPVQGKLQAFCTAILDVLMSYK